MNRQERLEEFRADLFRVDLDVLTVQQKKALVYRFTDILCSPGRDQEILRLIDDVLDVWED